MSYDYPPLVNITGPEPVQDGDQIVCLSQVPSKVRASVMHKTTNVPIGMTAYGSIGTNGVHVAGTVYFSEIFVPTTIIATKLAVLNGATVGTDKWILALYDTAGAFVIGTATAGTLSSGGDAFQEISLTATTTIKGAARYFLALQCNGTTDKTRKIAASTFLNAANHVAGVFGTLPASITVPTATAADEGPIGYILSAT